MRKEIAMQCKECGKPLPRGYSLISQAARTLGYCRYCYRTNVSGMPEHSKRQASPDNTLPNFDGLKGAEVFDPASPWDWYECYFPEKER